MRILYLHQHFCTPQGSGGTRSYAFARCLIKHGHHVTMVCGTTKHSGIGALTSYKDKSQRGIIDGIHVIAFDLPYSNYDTLFKRSITFFKFVLSSLKIVLTHRYDLLFATSTPLTVGIPGILLKQLKKKPFVFEVRDLWPEVPQAMGVIRNPLILGSMAMMERAIYRAADAAIGLSPGIIDGIKRSSRRDLSTTMIPNSSDLRRFQPRSRQQLNLPGIQDDDFVAVFAGAHGIANGLHAILETAAVLKLSQQPHIKLVFIGDGKLKPVLKQTAAEQNLDNCLFIDPIPKNQLGRYLPCFDCALMVFANIPAFYYGTSPNKFFDYIASGLPVINNYPGWVANLVNEHQCGVVVPPENPQAFAQALIDLYNHPQKRDSMGRQARKLAETSFNRDKLAEEFVAFLERSALQSNHPDSDSSVKLITPLQADWR